MKKNKNVADQYFKQNGFSIAEVVLIILIVVSAIAATFIRGGLPIGLPILIISISGFILVRSSKVKDEEIDALLAKLLTENNIHCTDNTFVGYELKNTAVKKRKDGKIISPKYYVTSVEFSLSEEIVFYVNAVDLINLDVTKDFYTVKSKDGVSLSEESVHTPVGIKKSTYLNIDGCEYPIPVDLRDYNSSQLIEKICSVYEKN